MIHKSMLKQIQLLKNLDDSTLQTLASKMHRQTLKAGEILFHKGDTSKQLYFLFDGQLKVIDLTEEGREIILAYIYPGQHFGEFAVLDHQPRSATLVAQKNSTLLYLDYQDALHLLTHTPEIAHALMQQLTHMLRTNNEMRQILNIPDTKIRIYHYLLKLIQQAATQPQAQPLSLPPQSEIAHACNTTRETVSRALNALIKKGIAHKTTPKNLEINAPALAQYLQNQA